MRTRTLGGLSRQYEDEGVPRGPLAPAPGGRPPDSAGLQRLRVGVFVAALLAPDAHAATEDDARRPWEAYLLLGYGTALCDNSEPDSDCPVDGGGAFGMGGGYRFHPRFSAGLEIGAWAFNVRDEWRGQLSGEATDVEFSSATVLPFARWYWFRSGGFDPYLHAGFGYSSLRAEATNDSGTYTFTARGLGYALGIGLEWWINRLFRLGPQLLGYLHVSGELCDKSPGESETCREPETDEDGEREGLALPWRFVLAGTFMFGER